MAKRPMLCLLLVLVTVLLHAAPAGAMPDALRFQHITLEQGLSQSSVLCSVQDAQGFLWFGTYDGLNRYDGYEFKVYRDGDGLSGNVVRSLLVDKDGVLWVGTTGGGLNRYDRDADAFTHYKHDAGNPSSLSSNEVLALFQDSRGALWVGTSNGLDLLASDGGFLHHRYEEERKDSLLGISVFAITEDNKGRLWVGTDEGLNRLTPDGGSFVHYVHNDADPFSIAAGAVKCLYAEQGDILWVGIDKGGLNRLDVGTGAFTLFFPERWVLDIFKDSRGILWAGTEVGLARRVTKRDPLTGRNSEQFLLYSNNPFDSSSISQNDIYTLLEDRSGILWIGTYGKGLCKLDPRIQEFKLLRREPWNPDTLSGEDVNDVAEDRDGNLWVGTTYGGLNKVHLETLHVDVYKNDPLNPGSFPAVEIRDMCLDEDGSLWMGTSDAGVIHFFPDTGIWDCYAHKAGSPNSLNSNNVYSIYDDRKGSIWVGMSKSGLNRLNKKTGEVTHFTADPGNPSALSHKRVRTIMEWGGYMWLGTNNGLNRLDTKTLEFTHWEADENKPDALTNCRVTALLPGPTEKTLWVGTHNGLNLFNMESGTFQRFTKEQGYGFASGSIAAMLRDLDGRLWISTFRGLSRFDPRSGEVFNYTPADGLQGYEVLDNSCFRNSRGELFFGGYNGLTWFDPKRIMANPHVPPVVLTGVRVMNKPLETQRNLATLDFLHLSPDADFFSFTFAGLDFVSPKHNTYAYKLEGFDKDWVNIGVERSATYTNIDPGVYLFRARAANSDGVWNDAGLFLHLEIAPPFWGTLWFRGIALATGVALLWLFYTMRVRVIKRQHQRLEAQVNARKEELARTYGQLQGIMEHSPSAIALKDAHGRYFLANPRFGEFYGVPYKAVEGLTDYDILDPKNAAGCAVADQAVWQTHGAKIFEQRIGEQLYMVQRFALCGDKGEPYAICSIVTDITERSVVEDALKASEARYRTLIANFPEGFVGLYDQDLRVTLADGAEFAPLGLNKHAVQGKPIFELLPLEACGKLEYAFRAALNGVSSTIECHIKGRDFDVRTLPIMDEDDHVLSGMIVARNITMRNEAEKARMESEQLYRSIAQLSPDAIFVHGANGILFANRAAVHLLGVASQAQLVGRPMLSLVQEDQAQILRELFSLARESNSPTHLVEIQLTAGHGGVLHVEMATVPIMFMEKAALLTIGRDITEKKLLMAETMRSAQLASLGELAAGVAHEINNPINGIINFAELIRDDPKKRLTYEDLPERIIKEGERIATIVRTLLSFSKGQGEAPTIAAVDAVLEDALRLCKNQLERDGIKIQVRIAGDMPPFRGKPGELQQVFINLLSNARAAINQRFGTEKFGKLLEVDVDTTRWKDRTMVRIAFTDNGVGIEPAVMERMFEPFYSTKPRNEGTGLGLSICHGIIQDHEGRIYFQSEPGNGTKAVVEVPAWHASDM